MKKIIPLLILTVVIVNAQQQGLFVQLGTQLGQQIVITQNPPKSQQILEGLDILNSFTTKDPLLITFSLSKNSISELSSNGIISQSTSDAVLQYRPFLQQGIQIARKIQINKNTGVTEDALFRYKNGKELELNGIRLEQQGSKTRLISGGSSFKITDGDQEIVFENIQKGGVI